MFIIDKPRVLSEIYAWSMIQLGWQNISIILSTANPLHTLYLSLRLLNWHIPAHLVFSLELSPPCNNPVPNRQGNKNAARAEWPLAIIALQAAASDGRSAPLNSPVVSHMLLSHLQTALELHENQKNPPETSRRGTLTRDKHKSAPLAFRVLPNSDKCLKFKGREECWWRKSGVKHERWTSAPTQKPYQRPGGRDLMRSYSSSSSSSIIHYQTWPSSLFLHHFIHSWVKAWQWPLILKLWSQVFAPRSAASSSLRSGFRLCVECWMNEAALACSPTAWLMDDSNSDDGDLSQLLCLWRHFTQANCALAGFWFHDWWICIRSEISVCMSDDRRLKRTCVAFIILVLFRFFSPW